VHRVLGLRLDVEDHLTEVDGGHPVDEDLVRLGQDREASALDALDEVHLPQRPAAVELAPDDLGHEVAQLALPAGRRQGSAADVDRPAIRVAVVRGHASTIALVRLLKQAEPVYADTYDPTFELLRSGKADAFASIREMLIQYSAQLPGSRVLDDSYQTNLAGVAVAKEKVERLGYVREFLDGVRHG